MPQVGSVYSLVLAIALIIGGIVLFVTGNPIPGALCIGAVVGNAAPSSLKGPT